MSGDMFLASMIDLGVDRKMLARELKKLPVAKSEINFTVSKAVRHSITGKTFRVKLKKSHQHRTYADIKGLIKESSLERETKKLASAIFKNIAVAEGKVHGIAAGRVHFHEVGAMDSIIDIVGAAVAVRSLGVERVYCSPLPLGSGWADTMHGRIPVPAPATVEILKGVPLGSSDLPFELTTPTGAAIARTLADRFTTMPAMTVDKIGYGAGKKDFKECANMMRAVLGTSTRVAKKEEAGEKVTVIEANIDDMTPQVAGFVMERLLDAGALDVFYTQAQMKKSRPALLLTVLAPPGRAEKLMDVIFEETTTIGVRHHQVERKCLERRTVKVETGYGEVRVKITLKGDDVVNVQPEYEDAKRLARKKKVPLKSILDKAKAAIEGK